jgi:hypothetical protein
MSNITPNDVPDDDTEGHRFVPVDERAPVGDTPPAESGDDDDTEGHKLYRFNVGVEFDPESDEPADTTSDAAPAASGDDGDNPDDTEGHKLYRHNVGID